MTPKLKKIITTLILIALLFVAYVVFVKEDPTTPDLVSNSAGSISGDAQVLGNQISQALLRIEQIKLDQSIFESELYKRLVDRSEPISEEPIGRPNPFAPLGTTGIDSVARTTGTSTSSARVQSGSTTVSTSSAPVAPAQPVSAQPSASQATGSN
jgi:hypothetical protein